MSKQRNIPLIDDQWEVGIDKEKFLSTIGEALFDLTDFKIGSFLKNLFKTAKQKEGLQDKAFELVFTALQKAGTALIKEYAPKAIEQTSNLATIKHGFKDSTRKSIEQLKVGITADFFKNPAAWSFLNVFRPAYTLLLQSGLNLEITTAQMMSFQIPKFFWQELIKEWDAHKKKYQPVAEHFNITYPIP